MKIFSAFLATETNTAGVVPTGSMDFESNGLYRGDASVQHPTGFGAAHVLLKRLAAADGHTLVESLTAHAQPSGITLRSVYEQYRDWILEDLRAAMPVQAVILVMHGAMVAEGYDDCEGDTIQAVRALVGPDIPIGVELDLHCHLSTRMSALADVIIAYKEYPHTDTMLRLEELYRLVVRQAAGAIRPVTAVHDLRMIGIWHTTQEPMRSFVNRMQACEGQDGILSVSLGHGFPWGDTPDTGAKLWVVADGDSAKAQRLATQLGEEFWALRHEIYQPPTSVEAAVDAVRMAPDGPIILADVADNPGGGAMSDSTFILRALLDADVHDVVLGMFWDLVAVDLSQRAGIGASLNLRIGGKCGPLSGDPVDLKVTVKAIVPEHFQHGLGFRWPLGTGVWVQTAQGLDIALCTQRSQPLSLEVFENLGIPLQSRKAIVVKSTQHFHGAFAPIAKDVIYVGAPGSISQNFAELCFKKRDHRFWPRMDNPYADA